jgi:methyltransferase (TIGR00027 family)
LEFKSVTLRRHGADPTANRVDVPVDLRQDWPKALQEAGFDPSAPTAWSAEGLLRFLPAWAQDLLFERIDAFSPAGSRLATNAPSNEALDPDQMARQREEMQRLRAVAAEVYKIEMPNFEELWYAEERTDIAAWLRRAGWDATVLTAGELMTRYGRSLPPEGDQTVRSNLFISAQRRED